jgi:hypothetical protein
MDAAHFLLVVDSLINLVLGLLLALFPESLATALGVPMPTIAFYPSILGGVLFGIGIALALECWKPKERLGGLGLGGAIAINLCGGIVLAAWLLRGSLNVPLRGYILMWALAIVLVAISGAELVVRKRHSCRQPGSGTSP